MAVAKLKRVIKKKNNMSKLLVPVSFFAVHTFIKCLTVDKNVIHPSLHLSIQPSQGQYTEPNKPSHTHSHLRTLLFSQFASTRACLEPTESSAALKPELSWEACYVDLVSTYNFDSLAAVIILQKLLVLALFSTSELLSPRLRLYYLLLYYTTPTFTPAPSEWEVIANANELCVGLLRASVWVGRSESAAACLCTC